MRKQINENQRQQMKSKIFRKISINRSSHHWHRWGDAIADGEISDELADFEYKHAFLAPQQTYRHQLRLKQRQEEGPEQVSKGQLYWLKTDKFKSIVINYNSSRWLKLEQKVKDGLIDKQVAEYRYKFGELNRIQQERRKQAKENSD